MRRFIHRVVLLVFLCGLLPARSEASLVWREEPGAPRGEVTGLAVRGSDVAVVFLEGDEEGSRTSGVALRTGGLWERLPLPGAASGPNPARLSAVALSESRLAVAERGGDAGGLGFRIHLWERNERRWALLAAAPAGPSGEEDVVGLEMDESEILVLSSRCRLLRYTRSSWSVPDGWPAASFGAASCTEPFVRDSGRLFLVAGAVYEYRQGRIEYPAQPEGRARRGVAVQPEGLAFVRDDGHGAPAEFFLPGRPGPIGWPVLPSGRIFSFHDELYATTSAGPMRLGEGRWTYTRLSGPPGPASPGLAWGPGGPFVEAEGVVYAASDRGLWVGRPSVRRLLPVAVRGSGLGGDAYRTELLLSNSGDAPVTARLELRAPSGSASGRWTAAVPLAPGTGTRIADALSLFTSGPDLPSAGSVTIEFEGARRDEDVWASADVVSSRNGTRTRTFVPAPQWGSGPSFNMFGAFGPIPRIDPSVRTNVGWTDAGDTGPDATHASLFLMRDARSWAMPGEPFELAVVTGQWEQKPLAAIHPGLAEGTVLELSGPVCYGPEGCGEPPPIAPRDLVAYAVEVDQESGDGSMTLFETLDLDADRSSLFFPVVVRSAGAGGTVWASELRLSQLRAHISPKTLFLRFRGAIGGAPTDLSWTLTPGPDPALRFDVAAEVLRQASLEDTGQPVIGTLLVRSADESVPRTTFGEMRVVGRRAESPGAFGVSIPGVLAGRLAASRAIVPGLSNDASLRSNLAVANAGEDGTKTLTLDVEIRRASDGAVIDSFRRTLGPGERAQWNDVGGAGAGATGDLYAVVRKTEGEGRFAAYGVVHDRGSGDGSARPMTGVE